MVRRWVMMDRSGFLVTTAATPLLLILLLACYGV